MEQPIMDIQLARKGREPVDKPITFKASESQREALVEQAALEDRALSDIIREAVDIYLTAYERCQHDDEISVKKWVKHVLDFYSQVQPIEKKLMQYLIAISALLSKLPNHSKYIDE